MRHQIDVVDRVEGDDGAGGRPFTDSVLETVFASIKTQIEKVEDEFGRVDYIQVHHIETRYTSNITHDKKLVFQPSGREFKILSVDNVDEVNREMLIRAVERKP